MKEFSSPFRAEAAPAYGKDRCRNIQITTGGRCEDMPLSEYVDSLDDVTKSRYFDKLKVFGLAAIDDPYASSDFQKRPAMFAHIFLLLHRVPWSLHTTGAAATEAVRSVQLFQEWIRQDSGV